MKLFSAVRGQLIAILIANFLIRKLVRLDRRKKRKADPKTNQSLPSPLNAKQNNRINRTEKKFI